MNEVNHQNPPPSTSEQEDDTKRRLDPELRVMGFIVRELERLGDEKASARVMEYLYDRFKQRG